MTNGMRTRHSQRHHHTRTNTNHRVRSSYQRTQTTTTTTTTNTTSEGGKHNCSELLGASSDHIFYPGRFQSVWRRRVQQRFSPRSEHIFLRLAKWVDEKWLACQWEFHSNQRGESLSRRKNDSRPRKQRLFHDLFQSE